MNNSNRCTHSFIPNAPRSALGFILILAVAMTSLVNAVAQDNNEGRYRPEGRQIARDVAAEFGERLFEVRTYDPEPNVAEFAGATVFYPLTLSFDSPVGLIAFSPGYRASQDMYDWWGPALASLGYATMIFDTKTPTDSQAARKQALIAAVDFLKGENTRQGSPLLGKLDTSKVALMGHSMGGGAALQAANEMNDTVDAVIPLSLYCCEAGQSFSGDFSSLSVPSLLFASSEDTVAPPEGHARTLFDSIGGSTAKAYVEFSSGDHMLAANGGPDLATLGKLSLAWLKIHLDGKDSLAKFIRNDSTKFAAFETSL